VTELDATVRALLGELAASDPNCKRFGARAHGYRLAPPDASMSATSSAATGATPRTVPTTSSRRDAGESAISGAAGAAEAVVAGLPADYRKFVAEIGAGGAGPFYGLIDVRAASAHPIDGLWGTGIPIAHAGCGYAVVLALDGSIWIDARAIGVVEPIARSFTAYYVTWLDHLARNQLPDAHVPAGRCALANALGGYLGVCEQRLGLAPGTIAGDALRDALAALGPGAIAIAADRSALFGDGELVDPCLACARLVDNLGLGAEVVAPGIAPRPLRSAAKPVR
jgi:hypothetical protein